MLFIFFYNEFMVHVAIGHVTCSNFLATCNVNFCCIAGCNNGCYTCNFWQLAMRLLRCNFQGKFLLHYLNLWSHFLAFTCSRTWMFFFRYLGWSSKTPRRNGTRLQPGKEPSQGRGPGVNKAFSRSGKSCIVKLLVAELSVCFSTSHPIRGDNRTCN